MIAVKEFSSAEEMQAHYRDLNKRLFAPKRKLTPLQICPLRVKLTNEIAAMVDRFREVEVAQSAKTDAPDLMFTPQSGKAGAKLIVAYVAAKHDMTPADILGPRRFKRLVEARWEAFRLVAEANPKWTLPQLGRFFDRDHTTLLHALRQMGVRS